MDKKDTTTCSLHFRSKDDTHRLEVKGYKKIFHANGNLRTGVSSVQSLSCVQLFVTPWTQAHQTSLSITNSQSLLKLMSIQLVMPSNHLILCHPILLLSSIFPSISIFSSESVLHIRWNQVAKVLEFQLQHQSFQWIFRTDFLWDLLVGSSCSPRDSQESSPTPQFKSISSSVLSLLYSPTLTSIHDYWKNHNFDQTDLYWQSNVCFLICCLGWS